MQVIGNLFSITIFTTMAGSLFTVILLFARKVLHLTLPLWSGVFGAAFFLIPFTVPEVRLFPPEETVWLHGYRTACEIWTAGVVFFLLYFILCGVFSYRAIIKYPVCTDERICRIYRALGASVHMRLMPELRFGALKDPVCVVTLLRPVIIINEGIAQSLTERELEIILSHELAHIQRKHHLFQRIYDLACCFHWFNAFIWIAKNDFALSCEMDCDSHTLRRLSEAVSPTAYAAAMLRLMELSAGQRKIEFGRMNALGFLLAKQRFSYILNRPTRLLNVVTVTVLTIFVVLTIVFSTVESRTYFYPYSAHNGEPEYSDTYVK